MDERMINTLLTDIYTKLDEIPLLRQKIDNWMDTTKEYRSQLHGKIDEIKNDCLRHISCMDEVEKKINELPCKERSHWYKSMSRQVYFMWLVLSIVLVAVVGLGISNLMAR